MQGMHQPDQSRRQWQPGAILEFLPYLLQGESCLQKHIEKYTSPEMYENVDKMIAEEFITMEIVIKGKSYIGKRACRIAFKYCQPDGIPTDTGHLDRCSWKIGPIIKKKWPLKSIGIQQQNHNYK
jgi:hypothetical protein